MGLASLKGWRVSAVEAIKLIFETTAWSYGAPYQRDYQDIDIIVSTSTAQ